MYYVHSHRSRCMEYNVGLYRICIKPSNFLNLCIGWISPNWMNIDWTTTYYDYDSALWLATEALTTRHELLLDGRQPAPGLQEIYRRTLHFPRILGVPKTVHSKTLEKNLQLQRGRSSTVDPWVPDVPRFQKGNPYQPTKTCYGLLWKSGSII